jgi:hypothetical protein
MKVSLPSGHIVGSECASGEGDTENLPAVWAEADVVLFDERPRGLSTVHMDLTQFFFTVWAHGDLACLDDFDLLHIDNVLLFGAHRPLLCELDREFEVGFLETAIHNSRFHLAT